MDERDYFDYPQDYQRWKREGGQRVTEAPLEVASAEIDRQIKKWRDTLDWLADR